MSATVSIASIREELYDLSRIAESEEITNRTSADYVALRLKRLAAQLPDIPQGSLVLTGPYDNPSRLWRTTFSSYTGEATDPVGYGETMALASAALINAFVKSESGKV